MRGIDIDVFAFAILPPTVTLADGDNSLFSGWALGAGVERPGFVFGSSRFGR